MKSNFDYCIIIPTVAIEGVLDESFKRFVCTAEENTLIVLSVNSEDAEGSDKITRYCENIFETFSKESCEMVVVWSETSIGFGEAVNKGCKYLDDNNISFKYITIANDDLVVPNGWQLRLSNALKTKHFTTIASKKLIHPIEKLGGEVGVVGPISEGVYNEQGQIRKEDVDHNDPDMMARVISQARENMYIPTNFLSGFCMMFSKKSFDDLCLESEDYYGLFDTNTYPVGGYEDNDVCERILNLGYRCIIAHDTYVGHRMHQTLDRLFENQFRGVGNKINHYLKYEKSTQGEKKVIGAYRISIKNINELNQLKTSLFKSYACIDGAAIVLTNNPGESLSSYDGALINRMPDTDKAFLYNCMGSTSLEDCAEHLENWWSETINSYLKAAGEKAIISDFEVIVKHWDGEFNEREERNYTHEIAESMGADWIFSIDADEFFEDRIDRSMIQRIVTHPNPEVKLYDVGFLNHWESPELIRTDWPFCTGYKQSMCGPRLFKVLDKAKMRIFGGNAIGLHCGNSPEYGQMARQTSSVRMRHLSHVRSIDRDAKFQFYQAVDKNKDPALIGFDDYSHINKREDVPSSAYKKDNGMAMFMLAYEQENPLDLSIWFDDFYAVFDRIILVWTGDFSDEDKEWLSKPASEWKTKDDWYKTGPSWELAHYIRLFKVEVLHEVFTEERGLADVRNSAIDHINKTNDGRIGWGLFFDPDEKPLIEPGQPRYSMATSLRRMAEINDTWAWMFNFANLIRGQKNPAVSDSIRMFRVEPMGIMKLSGRVHENFNDSLKYIESSGVRPKVKIAPFKCVNMGLAQDPEAMGRKLLKYQKMLLKELKNDPLNSGAWLSLGLQYMNDDAQDNCEKALERACMTAGTAYLPFKEMGILKLREAVVFFKKCFDRLKPSHPYYKPAGEMIQTLLQFSPPIPKIDTGSIRPSKNLPLPDFPYDRIAIDQNGEFIVLPEAQLDGQDNIEHKS